MQDEIMLGAEKALAEAAAHYEAEKARFGEIEAAYARLRGAPAPGTVQDAVRTWLPKILTYAGVPGAAAVGTAITADPGAFAGLLGAVKKLLGVFGVLGG